MVKASEIIKLATTQIGVKEKPSGSNKVIYNTEYYGREVSGSDYLWCCAFVWWVFKKCNASKLFYGGKKTAYCPTAMQWFKEQGNFVTEDFKAGDIAFFNFKGKNVAEHIGIIEKVYKDGTYSVIEGNTSTTSNDNGGCVMKRTRSKSQIIGCGRPEYDTEDLTSVNDIVWELNHRGIISNTALWLKKLKEDTNAYWLAYKGANLTVNRSNRTSLETVNDIAWELGYRKILTDTKLWLDVLEKDKDLYWLANKICNMTKNR